MLTPHDHHDTHTLTELRLAGYDISDYTIVAEREEFAAPRRRAGRSH